MNFELFEKSSSSDYMLCKRSREMIGYHLYDVYLLR